MRGCSKDLSGAIPPTPPKDASGGDSRGVAPEPHEEFLGALPRTPSAFEKAEPKLFYEKVLWCEQSAVNTEYSVFASNRLLFGGLDFVRRIIYDLSGRCPEPHEGCLRRAGRRPAPVPARLASEPMKKLDQNFSTEKFFGANSVRSIQNIAYLPDRLYIKKRLNLFAVNRRAYFPSSPKHFQ